MSKQARLHIILAISALAMIVVPMLDTRIDPAKADAAREAAGRFLEQVDKGGYAESWQLSAKPLQEQISQEKWVEKLGAGRLRTGALVERKEDDVRYTTETKDKEDGEYITLAYDSRFQKAPKVGETVIVMLEQDNRWRVAGYFVE